MKKRKAPSKMPEVTKAEAAAMPKTEAVLLRLTKADKATIEAAASQLHLTVTEYLTKSALLVAAKLPKG